MPATSLSSWKFPPTAAAGIAAAAAVVAVIVVVASLVLLANHHRRPHFYASGIGPAAPVTGHALHWDGAKWAQAPEISVHPESRNLSLSTVGNVVISSGTIPTSTMGIATAALDTTAPAVHVSLELSNGIATLAHGGRTATQYAADALLASPNSVATWQMVLDAKTPGVLESVDNVVAVTNKDTSLVVLDQTGAATPKVRLLYDGDSTDAGSTPTQYAPGHRMSIVNLSTTVTVEVKSYNDNAAPLFDHGNGVTTDRLQLEPRTSVGLLYVSSFGAANAQWIVGPGGM